jgi:hypothetical protein
VGSASFTDDSLESSPGNPAQQTLLRAQEQAAHDVRQSSSLDASPAASLTVTADHTDSRRHIDVSSSESAAPSEASSPVGRTRSEAQTGRGHRLRPGADLAPKASSWAASIDTGAAEGGPMASGLKVTFASSAVRSRANQKTHGKHRVAAHRQRPAQQGSRGDAPPGRSAGADSPHSVSASPASMASASERSLSPPSPSQHRSSRDGVPAVQSATPERSDAGTMFSMPSPVRQIAVSPKTCEQDLGADLHTGHARDKTRCWSLSDGRAGLQM